jgi:hypothetical protein
MDWFDSLPKDDDSGRYDWISPGTRRYSQAVNAAGVYATLDYLNKYLYGHSISEQVADLFKGNNEE